MAKSDDDKRKGKKKMPFPPKKQSKAPKAPPLGLATPPGGADDMGLDDDMGM